MGCDIHPWAEVRGEDGTWVAVTDDAFPLDEFDREFYGKNASPHPFDWRGYRMFGWLADVRYQDIEPLDEPRGLPDDLSQRLTAEWEKERDWSHTPSWFLVAELLGVNYDGGVDRGESLRDVLGSLYFEHLEVLAGLGDPKDVRVVFWFDN